jgi:hypothetical protein
MDIKRCRTIVQNRSRSLGQINGERAVHIVGSDPSDTALDVLGTMVNIMNAIGQTWCMCGLQWLDACPKKFEPKPGQVTVSIRW